MPLFDTPAGVQTRIPGVYTRILAQVGSDGPIPAFMVPVMLGDAIEGIPFDATLAANEQPAQPFTQIGTVTAARERYGRDSDLATGFAWAKRGGLGRGFGVVVNALTRASVVATSTGPVNEITLHAARFGAPGGHIKVAWDGTNLTVTPLAAYTPATADIGSGDTRIFVKDTSWMSVGQTVTIGDNANSNATGVIAAIGSAPDSSGQQTYFIDLTAAVGAAFTIAEDALVLDYAADVSSPTLGDGAELIEWVNSTPTVPLWATEVTGTFTGALPVTQTATTIKDAATWATATAGSSPASTSGRYDALVAYLDGGGWEAFNETYGILPRLYCALSDDSTVHQALRDYAAAERGRGFPCYFVLGGAWGDIDLTASDDTNPTYRANALNSQDVMLCSPGLDQLAPALSFAPLVFGALAAGGVGHNLTQDELTFTQVETRWDEISDGELTTLHNGGVCTYRRNVFNGGSFVISQGLSTRQANTATWNAADSSTSLMAQRTYADACAFVVQAVVTQLNLGANVVDRGIAAATLVSALDGLLPARRGWATSYSIASLTLTQSSWSADVSFTIPSTPDYAGIDLRVQV